MKASLPWIQTFTGKKYYVTKPHLNRYDIRDIAHALSNVCRFSGQGQTYNVAQHSVLCSYQVPEGFELDALMHDASEAYLGDIARPLKMCGFMKGYRELEKETELRISGEFATRFPMPECVKLADTRMLLTEQRDLLGPQAAPWGIEAEPYPFRIYAWRQEDAESRFMLRYEELTSVPRP